MPHLRARARREIPFVDLVPAFKQLPGRAVEPLFTQPGSAVYEAIAGHYTAAANRWAAEQLSEALRGMPACAAL